MCGRKTLTKDAQAIIEELLVDEWEQKDEYNPSYNIAPTQYSPILIYNNNRKIEHMRWGLVPSWAKDKAIGAKMINARGETLLEKPSFKNLVSSNRCIVITDGYFEWQNIGTTKTPHYFHNPEKKNIANGRVVGRMAICQWRFDENIYSNYDYSQTRVRSYP